MPLFYQQQINETSKLGIWQITEPEAFFLKQVPLKREVTHPHKRLQHLAGRYLLPALFDDFPLKDVLIADTRKPFLEKEQYHFSISHCGSYAAAIVSSTERVGVDIELIAPKIEKIRHKFLSETEWELVNQFFYKIENNFLSLSPHFLTLLWSCKEAIFKWYGYGQIDFKAHIQLSKINKNENGDEFDFSFNFCKYHLQTLSLKAFVMDNLALALLHTPVALTNVGIQLKTGSNEQN